MAEFKLHTKYEPTGDQPAAIAIRNRAEENSVTIALQFHRERDNLVEITALQLRSLDEIRQDFRLELSDGI